MVEKIDNVGIKISEIGFCSTNNKNKYTNSLINRCANEGECIEYYDKFKCNCTQTPFSGERCEQGKYFFKFY